MTAALDYLATHWQYAAAILFGAFLVYRAIQHDRRDITDRSE